MNSVPPNSTGAVRMQPATPTKAAPVPVAVFFRDSIQLVSELLSAAIGHTCDSIENTSDGLGLMIRKEHHDRARNIRYTATTFVPWGNVKSVKYSE